MTPSSGLKCIEWGIEWAKRHVATKVANQIQGTGWGSYCTPEHINPKMEICSRMVSRYRDWRRRLPPVSRYHTGIRLKKLNKTTIRSWFEPGTSQIRVRVKSVTTTIFSLRQIKGARGSVVGCGTMLQAGRSRVRFRMSLDFPVGLMLPAALWPCSRLRL
jgi:hypothetical protein